MGDPSEATTFGRLTVSTYGVLLVLAVAVVGSAGAPAFAAGPSGPADANAGAAPVEDRATFPSAAAFGSDGSAADADATGAGAAAQSGHSRDSYPDAPHMDVARGDIAAIETGIARSRTGTVRIESVDGEFDVTLTFANNDGRKPATLYLNTYLAGNESAVAGLAYTAGDSDRVVVDSRDAVAGAPMPVGAYDVTIERESETVTKRLTIDDPSVGELTLLRAPGDRFENLSTDRDITEGLESGVVSDPLATGDGPAPALGDTMVYRLNASGLYGLLAAQGGETAEDNFRAIEGDGASGKVLDLTIDGRDGHAPVMDVPASLDDGSMQVIPDATSETLYLTVDLRRAAYESADGWGDREFGRASVSVFDGSHLVDSNAISGVDFAVLERHVTYDPAGEAIRREAASRQTIAGETSLAPHSRLTFDVAAIGDDFDAQVEAEVDGDGTFATTVNLSEAPEDARLTLSTAEIDGSKTLLTTGDAPETAIWFQEYESQNTDEAIEIDGVTAALEDGGFVAAYAVPPDEQVTHENLIGRSDYLEPGVHHTYVSLDRRVTDSQTVVLAIHRDDDGDSRFDYPADDSPYRIDGDAVHTAGRVLLSGDSSNPPRDPEYLTVDLRSAEDIDGTPVPTATPTDTPTMTPTPTATPDPVGTTELPPPTLRGDETPTATPDGSATVAPNGTTAATATVNGTVGPNGTTAGGTIDGSTEGLGPGFGPVAVLVAGLVLALAALVRRS
ncbi:BGTF surface domain-containing protein [Halosimplex sp. TS25]|uniref:DUF7282 domain-containing protein n=1 Tax=Halosimplex rarum TaxID=3396619 RepID=UPI0039ECB301